MDNLAKAERRVPELDCHGKTCLVLHAHAISSEYPIFFDIHRATGVEEHPRVTPEPILQPPQHRCLHLLLIQLVKEADWVRIQALALEPPPLPSLSRVDM